MADGKIPIAPLPGLLFVLGAFLGVEPSVAGTEVSRWLALLAIPLALVAVAWDSRYGLPGLVFNGIVAYMVYKAGLAPPWACALLALSSLTGFMLSKWILGMKRRLLRDLESFRPEPVRDEEDLEKQLYQYLRAKGYRVRRQPRLPHGLRADLQVGECILELKVARSRDQLQRLVGQLRDYRRFRDCVIALVVDEKGLTREYGSLIEETGARLIVK